MDYAKLSLSQQMKYAQHPNSIMRITFAASRVLPEVADLMIEKEQTPDDFNVLCLNLFFECNSNVWPSTLSKAVKKIIEFEEAKVLELGESSKDFDISLSYIALHLNTDAETLENLYDMGKDSIYWAIASNHNTPQAILVDLATLKDFSIDIELFHNPNTPKRTHSKIYKRYPKDSFNELSIYERLGIKIEAGGN